MFDPEFSTDGDALNHAVRLLTTTGPAADVTLTALPTALPEGGLGGRATLDLLAPLVLGGASRMGSATAMAHMDPPTPWITWATTMWNASLNQNLLHPATAPIARDIEARVIEWLAPFFGMGGGHMVPGSTIANLTALWAARECAGVEDVVCAESAHLSVPKAAHILGLRVRKVACDHRGAVIATDLPADLQRSALVLTAGSTSTGTVDDLALAGRAAWTHIDAAWAGPLRLSETHAHWLAGIENADSVAVSAHKWLFQPKESALVLFRDAAPAHASISFGGAYLSTPNIGVLGSHGAVAVPMLATLLAMGRKGVGDRIDRCMTAAEQLATFIASNEQLELLERPNTGVVVWRPHGRVTTEQLHAALPAGSTSLTSLGETRWLRNVAANPDVDVTSIEAAILAALPA